MWSDDNVGSSVADSEDGVGAVGGSVADSEDGVGAVGGSVADPYDSDSDRSDAETVAINWEGDAFSEASTVIIEDQDLSGF